MVVVLVVGVVMAGLIYQDPEEQGQLGETIKQKARDYWRDEIRKEGKKEDRKRRVEGTPATLTHKPWIGSLLNLWMWYALSYLFIAAYLSPFLDYFLPGKILCILPVSAKVPPSLMPSDR